MSGKADREYTERKQAYFKKVVSLCEEYSQVLVVGCDNVGSNSMQRIRLELRKFNSVFLMGKNTMIRKALRGVAETKPELEKLIPTLKGNVGFIFTNGKATEILAVLGKYRVEAPAKAGILAQRDVLVNAQLTTLEPTKTNFFQALNITTKITKGAIEIMKDVHLIKVGTRVGQSEAALLKMLGVLPFSYGLELLQIYDNGDIYGPDMLSVTDDSIVAKFASAVQNIAAVSLGANFPTLASAPHYLARGFRNVVALSLGSGYKIPKIEALLSAAASAGPAAAAPAAAAKAAAPAAAAKAPAPAPAPAKEESAGETEVMSLFG